MYSCDDFIELDLVSSVVSQEVGVSEMTEFVLSGTQNSRGARVSAVVIVACSVGCRSYR